MTASVSELITRVKRLITLPADDTLFQTSDFMGFINDCLIEKVYPRLMKIRDDYCLVREVFNLQNSQAQDLYPTGVMPIPNRAWGNTLREIKYIDISGNYYKVNPYFLEDLDLYQTKNLAFSSTYQKGFIPYNSGIKLIPPPMNDQGSIEMYYIITPSIMINRPDYGDGYTSFYNIQFNSSTNVATYTTGLLTNQGYLDDYCQEQATALFDIYNAGTGMLLAVNVLLYRELNSGGYSIFTGNCTVQTGTNIISPNITEITNFQYGGFPVTNANIAQGIYLVPAGQNVFSPIPPVLDNLLVYELGIKILSAQGYIEELQIFKAEHDDLRKDLLSQMAMRVETEPSVISNKRGLKQSILYGGSLNRRRR